MYKHQAKKLKAGDTVVRKERDGVRGVVTRKHYNTIWIKWDDQSEDRRHFAEAMDNVFTVEQLDGIGREKRLAEEVKKISVERLKTHPAIW